MISLSDIQQARETISPHIHRTPLIHSNSLSILSGAEVYLKLENLQKTGSFKVRGAFNKLTRIAEHRVIAASMGNHAQAVAHAAGKLGKQATIVMPETASIIKQEATRGYGAEIILHGEKFSDALDYALSRKDAVFIHPFDDDVIAGQGTTGLEIAEELDAIAVGKVGERPLALMGKHVDAMFTVAEDPIARAILLFLERKKLVVEGAGAVPLAALLENKDRFRGKRVVLVVSGGNIDFTLIDRIILKGLMTSGRIGVFAVVIDDIAGSLHAVTGIIGSNKANILSVAHDRTTGDVAIGKARVVFTVEVRSREHLASVLAALRDRGYGVRSEAPSRD
jgi:threonine dehydratase